MITSVRYQDEVIPIYWYDDAGEIIYSLARRFRSDVTEVRRGGRDRGSYLYYKEPFAFDIETTTILPGELDYWRDDGRPIAFPYLFQFCIYGTVIMCRQISEAMSIFDMISSAFIGNSGRRIVMFDHNLGYEYGFFKDLWPVNGKRSFALDEHHPVTIELENGIILRDSYKMTNMSLQTLTADWSVKYRKNKEIMDYSLQRTPYTDLDHDTILYSALDVLSLCDAIVPFLAARGERIWTKCPTSTSFIRASLKKEVGYGVKTRTREQKKYIAQLQEMKITAQLYEMLIRQARGGNTHANRRITGIIQGDPETGSGVYHADITSSYPAQMVCYPEFPIAAWQPLDPDCPISTIELFEANGYCTLFDIVLLDPEIRPGVTVPYIPNSKAETLKGYSEYSDNGRYLRGAAMLKMTIYGIEWPIIKAQYKTKDTVILGGWFAKKGYLPDIIRRFVLALYAKKTELKGIPEKEVEYALAKTYVNGVFGMAFTRIIRDLYVFSEDDIVLSDPKDTAEELERYQGKTSYFLPYAWGSMVATLGRVYLQKMIDACGRHFLYCDTDSVFASHPEIVRPKMQQLEKEITAYQRQCGLQLVYNDIKGQPHELGGIDEEPECAFMTYGAKKYITVDKYGLHSTIAGVPKKEGAEIIGSWDNFKLGMVFSGKETNKMCLWYNDNEDVIIHDQEGREIRTYSNVAMLPVSYVLSLSDDYTLCLQIEGINPLYSFDFKEANPNQNEDYI